MDTEDFIEDTISSIDQFDDKDDWFENAMEILFKTYNVPKGEKKDIIKQLIGE